MLYRTEHNVQCIIVSGRLSEEIDQTYFYSKSVDYLPRCLRNLRLPIIISTPHTTQWGWRHYIHTTSIITSLTLRPLTCCTERFLEWRFTLNDAQRKYFEVQNTSVSLSHTMENAEFNQYINRYLWWAFHKWNDAKNDKKLVSIKKFKTVRRNREEN